MFGYKKKMWRSIWLGLLGILLLISFATVNARADLTDTMLNVKNEAYQGGGYQFSPTFIGGFDDAVPNSYNTSYSGINTITANYTKNGAVTNKTTKIAVTFNAPVTAMGTGITMSEFYLDVFKGKGTQVGGTTTIPASVLSSKTGIKNLGGGTSVNLANNSVTFNVDLSNLTDLLPLYIGFHVKTVDGQAAYRLAALNVPTVKTGINPTITGTDDSSTTSSVKVKSTDTTIDGVGSVAGDTVSTTVNGKTVTAKVQDDKSYHLDLGEAIGENTTTVKVTETNDSTSEGGTGATGTAAATVVVYKPKVTLDVTKDAFDFVPADLDDLSDDSAVQKWVNETAGVKGTATSGGTVSLTYKETDLLASLNKLAAGESVTVHVRAEADGENTDYQAITITKKAGTLSFGTSFPAIDFGTHKITTAEMKYGPASPIAVPINDTRELGTSWTLTANASAMTGDNGTLKGNVSYQDKSGNIKSLTDTSIPVATGTRSKGASTNAVNGWSSSSSNAWTTSDQGIFLDVQPGTKPGSYSGTIEWTLADTVPN